MPINSNPTLSTQDIKLKLSPLDTEALKGVALILLLFHHLFYVQNGNYDDIYILGHGIVNSLGQVCKICVPLFVFLSGYGLCASTEKFEKINIHDFFKKRFVKLYANYWLIWLLFVPLGIVLFDMTFPSVYGENWQLKLPLDFLGLLNCFDLYGYNPTWWFYSCIILLYLLFPIIYNLCNSKYKKVITHLIFWFTLLFAFIPLPFVKPIRYYLFTFILGIFFRNGMIEYLLPSRIKTNTKTALSGQLSKSTSFIVIMLIMICVPIRLVVPYSLIFDTIIAVLIIVAYRNIRFNRYVHATLRFMGRHSFNIFLFHTFLFFLYIPQIIYFDRNPIIIFFTLLLFCITISISIEYLKKISGYNNLVNLMTTGQSK